MSVNIEFFQKISNELNLKNVKLIAVSKTKSEKDIMLLYSEGQRIFGENKVQEMLSKAESLPKDIKWHLIGHLQTNKVKYIVEFVSMVHSIDSLKLLLEIDRQAQKYNRAINCLLQFHIATEESKFGLNLEEANDLLNAEAFKSLKNIRICGVMGMASFSDDNALIRGEFRNLKNIYQRIKDAFFLEDDAFCEISMGMSGDFEIATSEGSSMVRIGSLLFGQR